MRTDVSVNSLAGNKKLLTLVKEVSRADINNPDAGTASEESNVTTGAAVPDRVGWDEIKRKNARKRAAN